MHLIIFQAMNCLQAVVYTGLIISLFQVTAGLNITCPTEGLGRRCQDDCYNEYRECLNNCNYKPLTCFHACLIKCCACFGGCKKMEIVPERNETYDDSPLNTFQDWYDQNKYTFKCPVSVSVSWIITCNSEAKSYLKINDALVFSLLVNYLFFSYVVVFWTTMVHRLSTNGSVENATR